MKYLTKITLVLGFAIIGACALIALLMVSLAQLVTNLLPRYPDHKE